MSKFNSADGKYEITSMTRAKIDYTGTVVWVKIKVYREKK
jgi:hypothetical protein